MKKLMPFALCAAALGACSASSEPARSPAAAAAGTAKDEAKPAGDGAAPAAPGDAASDGGDGLPDKCAEIKEKVCLPPPYVARALCNADFPTVALAMFANGTPWTRAYSVTTSAA